MTILEWITGMDLVPVKILRPTNWCVIFFLSFFREAYPRVSGVLEVRGWAGKTVNAAAVDATLHAVLYAVLAAYAVGLAGFAAKYLVAL